MSQAGGSDPIDRIIDTEGGRPRLKVGALAATLLGTVFWGWLRGLLTAIVEFGGGITGSIAGIETWLSRGVIGSLFSIPELVFEMAFAFNSFWVGDLGVWGQPIAVIEIGILSYLVVATLATVIGGN